METDSSHPEMNKQKVNDPSSFSYQPVLSPPTWNASFDHYWIPMCVCVLCVYVHLDAILLH